QETADGKTALLSSHILAEAEKLCERVSIIRQGRIVESGTLDDLRHLTRTSVRVTTDSPVKKLAALPGVHDLDQDGTDASFEVDSDQLGDVMAHVSAAGIRTLVSTPPTLEDLFMRHYGDELEQLAGNGEKR